MVNVQFLRRAVLLDIGAYSMNLLNSLKYVHCKYHRRMRAWIRQRAGLVGGASKQSWARPRTPKFFVVRTCHRNIIRVSLAGPQYFNAQSVLPVVNYSQIVLTHITHCEQTAKYPLDLPPRCHALQRSANHMNVHGHRRMGESALENTAISR